MPLYRYLAPAFAFGLFLSGVQANAAGTNDDAPHAIRHIFVIVLENKSFSDTFAPDAKAPYLSRTLAGQGALLTQYYGTTHASTGNYTAMLSGQANTPEISRDCTTYMDFKLKGMTEDGQAIGRGCVYPASVKTLADQLNDAGLTWKGYMGDMGNDPARESATCGHPELNGPDLLNAQEGPSARVPQGDMYATRHNPFVYFHSIIDSPLCHKNVVNLDRLADDLKSVATTANFNFITPNVCDDGHDAPCADGRPGGLASINVFLQKWVPRILASPAYQTDGLLIINFDEGSGAGTIERKEDGTYITIHGASCCGQKPGPNMAPYPQVSAAGSGENKKVVATKGFGGDRTGAVLLSPFIKPGTISNVPYNHYSFLKSVEDLLGLKGHLGYAEQPGLMGFGSDIFSVKVGGAGD